MIQILLQNLGLYLDVATKIITFIFLLIGGLAGTFIFFQLAPILTLHITPSWVGEKKEYLLLRFEVANKSRVRVRNAIIRIQVLEQKNKPHGEISNWVPLKRDTIKDNEIPVEWREPIESSEPRIFPGETITIERLYHYPQKAIILHAALQVEVRLSFWNQIVTRKRTRNWRQITTCFVVK